MAASKLKGGSFRLLDRVGRFSARVGVPLKIKGKNSTKLAQFDNASELVGQHFEMIDQCSHICRSTLEQALVKLSGMPSRIVETGSSAWGTNSSVLFDSYVRRFGGSFETVDIRTRPMYELRSKLGSNSLMHCADSVAFLENWARKNPETIIDLVYLDSWDLDVNDPWPSALHGLREFIALEENLSEGSLLLVDDTPLDLSYFSGGNLEAASSFFRRTGLVPGKGMLINSILEAQKRAKKISHEYQVLWQFL